jgi:hypothetical protein
VLQETDDDGHGAIVFAFKADADDGRVLVRLRGLVAGMTYDVHSADAGDLGSATGDALMQGGIELVHRDGSRAHVLALRARPEDR